MKFASAFASTKASTEKNPGIFLERRGKEFLQPGMNRIF
jgi:hypothetical protein